MSDVISNTTIVWAALLTRCESTTVDLSEADPAHQECAEQMRDAGILEEIAEHEFTLSTDGMRLLQIVENLRDYSLGIN